MSSLNRGPEMKEGVAVGAEGQGSVSVLPAEEKSQAFSMPAGLLNTRMEAEAFMVVEVAGLDMVKSPPLLSKVRVRKGLLNSNPEAEEEGVV